MRRISEVLSTLILMGAASGRAQPVQSLEYSDRSMALASWTPDTIQIRNPDRASLRCDSVVLLLPDNGSLGGMLVFGVRNRTTGTTGGLRFYLRDPLPVPDPKTGGYRSVYPYGLEDGFRFIKLDFPGSQTLDFIWQYYDACPTCKQSATPTSADSVFFRMVFHVGRTADTLHMAIDKRLTVGLAPLRAWTDAPKAALEREGWDFLGRWKKGRSFRALLVPVGVAFAGEY